VEVTDGVVTLAGGVRSYTEKKWLAERAAQRVSGVNALAIELEVKLPGSDQRTDADIARSVEYGLEWSTSVPAGAVKAMVEGGWVTLSGTVDWQYQRRAAADSVRCLLGVTGVSDQIAIKPEVSIGANKDDFVAALKRSATADAKEISVGVSGAEVTLTGKVHSWAERETAMTSAWATPGVVNVVDKMTMSY
jgi:osmotically-inducible protein OsmY